MSVSHGGFPETFDFADGKSRLCGGLIDIAHPFSLHGLHIAVGHEAADGTAVSHCMTRMRFALVEPKEADVRAIEAMKVVKGSFTQSGQFQVIIGNTVADFYNDFVKEAGIEACQRTR